MEKESRVKGIVISYLTTIIRTISKLVLTPIYLRILGIDDYGFYQYIFSIASYVTVLDFGISQVINSFTIRCRELHDDKGADNVVFYTFVFSIIIAIVVALIGTIISLYANEIFGSAIYGKVQLARQLLFYMVLELIMLLMQHYFEGIILASEKYVTLKGVDLTQIVLRCTITLILLYSGYGVISIALGDCIGVGICLSYEIIYSFRILKLRLRMHSLDKALIASITKLAFALCLQSIIIFLNSSIDKYILGRYVGTAAVTIYTVALTFSIFFDEISAAIQRLYLPQAVKLVSQEADGETLTDFVIVPGRFQLILCAGALGAFVLFGKEFIILWSGPETIKAWIIALLLMFPSILPSIENICISILTAKNKRLFRSIVLGGVAIANLFLTVVLVKKIGIMGAPIGTCISLLLGNNLIINIYYKKEIGINVTRLIKSIMHGILPSVIISVFLCLPLRLITNHCSIWFVIKCLLFCMIYTASLRLIGLNENEKKIISRVIKNMKKII